MKRLTYMITVGAMLALTNPVQAATSKAEDNLPKIVCIQTNCDNPNNRNQNVTKLFDMDEQSKWYADKGFSGKFPCIILWEYDGALAVKSYSLTSGNDVPGRDPKSWKLFGSADGKVFHCIDTQNNVQFADRNETLKFVLKETADFQTYKLEINKVANGATPPQLSEIALEPVSGACEPVSDNVKIVPLLPVEVVKPLNITSDCDNPKNKNQQVANLFDGKPATKWFADKGFLNAFPCYIAWEYAKPLKVVSYSLTSGNDVPNRDPKSWVLYGSANGKDYVVIDKQDNVEFESRTETKDFNLIKGVSYKFFKLEIHAVKAGNTSTPPQLGEIELK